MATFQYKRTREDFRLDLAEAQALARLVQDIPGASVVVGARGDDGWAQVTVTHGGERALIVHRRVAALVLDGLRTGVHRAALWEPIPLSRAKLAEAVRGRLADLERRTHLWPGGDAAELAWVRELLSHLEEGGWE